MVEAPKQFARGGGNFAVFSIIVIYSLAVYFGLEDKHPGIVKEWLDKHVDLHSFFNNILSPTGQSTYEIVEDLSFFTAFQNLGIGSFHLPDSVRDAIVAAGGFIDYGHKGGAAAYAVTQDATGLVHFTKVPAGTDTSHYFAWGAPPPEAEPVPVPQSAPKTAPTLATVPKTEPVTESVHHPKIDYDLATRNLSGISDRYHTDTPTDVLTRGLQQGALQYADGGIVLTDAEAQQALHDGSFTKDGVRFEVWQSREYPGTFYITKLPA